MLKCRIDLIKADPNFVDGRVAGFRENARLIDEVASTDKCNFDVAGFSVITNTNCQEFREILLEKISQQLVLLNFKESNVKKCVETLCNLGWENRGNYDYLLDNKKQLNNFEIVNVEMPFEKTLRQMFNEQHAFVVDSFINYENGNLPYWNISKFNYKGIDLVVLPKTTFETFNKYFENELQQKAFHDYELC